MPGMRMTNAPSQAAAPEWLRPSNANVVDEVASGAAQFVTKECRAIYEWWAAFLPVLPTRGAVPLARFAKLLPDIYLSQLIDDQRFEVRIQGERVKAMLGGDTFPRSFGVHDEGFAGLVAHNYREAIRRRVALRHFGTMHIFNRDHISFESADFPVLGDNGAPPYILGVIAPLDEGSIAVTS